MNEIFRNYFHQFARALQGNREYQFWFLQLVGWVGLCVVTFLSLTLWYNAPEWSYVLHTIVQAALGMSLTIPLRHIYRTYWQRSTLFRLVLSILVIIAGALAWTVLRMFAFQIIITEENLWNDFGGWYFGSFMVFASWTSIYYGAKYYHLLMEEQRAVLGARQLAQDEHVKRLVAEAHSRNAQLKMLRYQINPHFLFNTLNSISALIKTDRNEQARTMIFELSSFLRFSLVTDPALKVSLEKELEMLTQYLNIEKARYGKRLTVTFDIDERANAVMLPSLLLQPLYENALKYAIAGRKEGGTISLIARIVDDRLRLRLDDTGPGLTQETSQEGLVEVNRGVGLRNTRARLQSQYEDEYSFELRSLSPHGLSVLIEIPAEYEINQSLTMQATENLKNGT